jgi:thymidylate synthase
MHLVFGNVNEAFYQMVWGFHDPGLGQHCGLGIPTEVTASRYGEVMAVDEPVTVTFKKPTERVLFNVARDANPFFHLYESLWMLAGHNDVAPLAYYNSRMSEFSDEGAVLNGAYGYRWRHALAPMWVGDDIGYPPGSQKARPIIDEPRSTIVDQLSLIVGHLRASPHSRRAVLSMWNVEDDLLKVDSSKDVCCNLAATFQVGMGVCPACNGRGYSHEREGETIMVRPPCEACGGKPHDVPRYLNMTVFNRSNDLIWGMLGTNAVHFSILLEYLAARLGLEAGKYHQITANLHAYTDNWHPEEWLKSPYRDLYDEDSRRAQWQWMAERGDSERRLLHHPLVTVPLVKDPDRFDRECPDFVEHNHQVYSQLDMKTSKVFDWGEPFLRTVAQPMCNAFHSYKCKRDFESALRWADLVAADDWRIAALGWLKRRLEKKGVKT